MEILIQMTLLGSIATLIVLVINTVLGRWMKKTWKYMLWVVVVMRFLVPIMPTSSVSIFNYMGNHKSNHQTVLKSNVEKEKQFSREELNQRIKIKDDEVIDIKESEQKNRVFSNALTTPKGDENLFIPILTLLWAPGCLGVFAYFIYLHSQLKMRLKALEYITEPELIEVINICKNCLKIKNNISMYYGQAPSLVGLIKPIIILPKGYSNKEYKAIILHELIHYKYKDHWISMLQLVMVSLHWFNPIVWLLTKTMNLEAEFACDERVLCVEKDKKAYMETLLKLATNRVPNEYLLVGMSSNKKQLKGRIKEMVNPVKNKKWVSYIIVLLLIGVSVSLLTNKKVVHKDVIASKKIETNKPTSSKIKSKMVSGNILVLGQVEEGAPVDSIFLVELNNNNKAGEAIITSVPRDTKIELDENSPIYKTQGIKECKASQIIPYSKLAGRNAGAERMLVKEIEKCLNKKIDYYIKFSPNVFTKIDEICGDIQIDVSQDMYYIDHAQELTIDLKQGEQALNADEMDMFVRYRRLPNGDLDRIKNQQRLIQAIINRAIEIENPVQLLEGVKYCLNECSTNLGIGALAEYGIFVSNLKEENIHFKIAEGEAIMEKQMSYYILNH